MSQEINTVFGSWGLMVGLNMAPPPPGPRIRKSPGRCAKALAKNETTKNARNNGIVSLIGSWDFRASIHRSAAYGSQHHASSYPELEGDSQSEANCPLAKNSLLGKTVCQLAKKRVDVDI